ncbi:hypothetical protein BLNAU_19145 [Blattamonas nauphoetae]|uniref:AIG1-type G domain-containing protein n=1 Tax=Blattamonas nauphoetae TaxID=2049346 RepID=A0ABQ9X2X1_9EUKA|nr:hypothetical protein BLNAU_19145 [Blattamonas nauphoetae]
MTTLAQSAQFVNRLELGLKLVSKITLWVSFFLMSRQQSTPQTITVTALGPALHGKSQFLSMLFGQEVFTVGHTGFPHSQQSHALERQINWHRFRLVDQSGFSERGQDEQRHLDTICQSLRNERSMNVICLCVRIDGVRVGENIHAALRHIRNMFATPDIYPHMCLVLTFTQTPQMKSRFLNKILPTVNKHIEELFDDQRKVHGDLPIFFVDSAINLDRRTLKEKERFLAHVSKLSAFPTSNINRLDGRLKLVTEEIVTETTPGRPRPFMVTVIRDGIQMDPECGELMPTTIHQNVRRLRLELWHPDEYGRTTSFRTIGPVGEPWETVDDSCIRVFKKEVTTRRTITGATQLRQRNFDRNGKCIEASPWIQIKENTENDGDTVGAGVAGLFFALGAFVLSIIL